MAYQPVRLGCKQFAIILKNAFCICLLLSKYFWAPEVPRKMFVSFWCNACSAHFFESWDQDLLQWLVCQRFASDLLVQLVTPHTHTQSKGNNIHCRTNNIFPSFRAEQSINLQVFYTEKLISLCGIPPDLKAKDLHFHFHGNKTWNDMDRMKSPQNGPPNHNVSD